MSACSTTTKGKRGIFNEKKALSLNKQTKSSDQNHFSEKRLRPRASGTPRRVGPHLEELAEDSVTLVSSDRDFWEIDRNGCVVQHLQLILNPRK